MYGSEAVIPAEVGMPTLRTTDLALDPETQEASNQEGLRVDKDLLEEKRMKASLHEAKVKERVKRYHDRRVRKVQFTPGDLVMRKQEKSRQGPSNKLAPNWEGPYKVTGAYPGGRYTLETMKGDPIPRRWNIVNLRKYHGPG